MDAAELTSGLVGRDVLDAAGHLLGRLDSLFRDLDDPAVTFAAVAMIRRGRRRLVFVPLIDATVRRASVTLRCGAELARRAPQIRPGRSLPADLEGDLYRHYDIPYHACENATGRLRPVT